MTYVKSFAIAIGLLREPDVQSMNLLPGWSENMKTHIGDQG